MVRDVAIDGGNVGVAGRAHRRRAARCATEIQRTGSRAPSRALDGVATVGLDFTVMTDERARRRCARALHGDPAATAGSPAGPRPRRGPGHPVRRPESRTRVPAHRLGQGRRGQVVGHHQPGRRAGPAGHSVGVLDADVYGFSIPRMLGVDRDPVRASTRCSCRPRPTACAASRWASSPRRTSRSSGGARCCTRRSSSSSPTSTGTTPTSCWSTCRRAPATSRSRSPSSCPGPRSTSSPRRSRRRQTVAQRAGFMAEKVQPRR